MKLNKLASFLAIAAIVAAGIPSPAAARKLFRPPVPNASDATPATLPAPKVTVTADRSTPAAYRIIMGIPGNQLAVFRIENLSSEEVAVTDVRIAEEASPRKSSAVFTNVTLACASCAGAPVVAAAAVDSFVGVPGYQFILKEAWAVPAGSAIVVSLTGDAASSKELDKSADNSTHVFSMMGSRALAAVGRTSNKAARVDAKGRSNKLTVLKSNVAVSGSTTGAVSERSRSTTDTIGAMTLAAAGGDATVTKIVVTFEGLALSRAKRVAATLIDASTGAAWGTSRATCTGRRFICRATFTGEYVIPAGAVKQFNLEVDSSAFANGSVKASIQNRNDIVWTDGITRMLSLETAPVDIAAASYVSLPDNEPLQASMWSAFLGWFQNGS